MAEIIQSAWGIVYQIDKQWNPRYLLIKRHSLSNKIERVAPKGKIQKGEKIENAALREISEEAGIPINQLKLKTKVGVTQLRNTERKKGQIDKDVTYFLVEYTWDPYSVHIEEVEGYVWVYKRATIEDVLGLVYYQDIRELVRQSYHMLKDIQKKTDIKKDFMKKLT